MAVRSAPGVGPEVEPAAPGRVTRCMPGGRGGPGGAWAGGWVEAWHGGVGGVGGGVVGALVGERLLDAVGFGLDLKLGVAAALLVGTCLDAKGGQRVEVGRIDAQRSLHQCAIARPLVGAQSPVASLLLLAAGGHRRALAAGCDG